MAHCIPYCAKVPYGGPTVPSSLHVSEIEYFEGWRYSDDYSGIAPIQSHCGV